MNKINIVIAAEDVEALTSLGLKLALSRATAEQNPAGLVWRAFHPAPVQQVSWCPTLDIFAASAPPRQGSVLAVNSRLDQAAPDRIYDLGPGLVFSGPSNLPGLGDQTYAVDNGFPSSVPISIGLAQGAEINGLSTDSGPLVAGAAMQPFRTTFRLVNVAYLSLRSDAQDGLVFDPADVPPLPNVSAGEPVKSSGTTLLNVGPLTKLDFNRLGPSLTATYNRQTGGFTVTTTP